MRRGAVHAAAVLIAAAAAVAPTAWATTDGPALPAAALRDAGVGLRPAGQGRLTWFGLHVYDARLWVESAFQPASATRHRVALELTYHRALRAADIARRSIAEMERSGPIAPADAQRWQAQLQLLPDVRPGDRILGLHLPGQAAHFYVNGRFAGRIADAAFAERFFGIWLAPATSEPRLREALLAGAGP